MRITATFDSLEEFQKFISGKKPLTAEELNKTAQKTADIINAAEAKEAKEKAEGIFYGTKEEYTEFMRKRLGGTDNGKNSEG